MCVIVYCENDKIPEFETFQKCWDDNSHGAGIAWFNDKGTVSYIKGIKDVLDLYDIALLTPTPFVMHFREKSFGSAGGEINELLTHPFEITEESELKLTGEADRVLFQNGTVSEWNMYLAAAGMEPNGLTSDARALARIISKHKNNDFLLKIPGVYVVMDGKEKKCLSYGKFQEDNKSYFSNLKWKWYKSNNSYLNSNNHNHNYCGTTHSDLGWTYVNTYMGYTIHKNNYGYSCRDLNIYAKPTENEVKDKITEVLDGQEKQVMVYWGYKILMKGLVYSCPELSLYGYGTERGIMKAVNDHKETQKKNKEDSSSNKLDLTTPGVALDENISEHEYNWGMTRRALKERRKWWKLHYKFIKPKSVSQIQLNIDKADKLTGRNNSVPMKCCQCGMPIELSRINTLKILGARPETVLCTGCRDREIMYY